MAIVTPKMEGLKRLDVLRAYCDYVEEHLRNVGKAWEILQAALAADKVIWDDFDFWMTQTQIEKHDLSKMDYEEFVQYAEHFKGTSLNKADFDAAWKHHKENNPHHWQTWTQGAESFPGETKCHVVCMVADWMAMGVAFGDTAESYYEHDKSKMNLPEWAVEYIYRIFAALRVADGDKS